MSEFELFKEEFRNQVLAAMDNVCEDFDVPVLEDSDLPDLFKSLDRMAKILWERDDE